jgi:hypothetical protein
MRLTPSERGQQNQYKQTSTVSYLRAGDRCRFVKLIEGGTPALESLGREVMVNELGQETAKSDEAHVVTELNVQMEKTRVSQLVKGTEIMLRCL